MPASRPSRKPDPRPVYHLDRERDIVSELLASAHGDDLVLLTELRDLLDECD